MSTIIFGATPARGAKVYGYIDKDKPTIYCGDLVVMDNCPIEFMKKMESKIASMIEMLNSFDVPADRFFRITVDENDEDKYILDITLECENYSFILSYNAKFSVGIDMLEIVKGKDVNINKLVMVNIDPSRVKMIADFFKSLASKSALEERHTNAEFKSQLS
jgi:hypothetical protein